MSSIPSKEAGSGLRGLLIRGSVFEMSGFGASQIIRFGSNLWLSRLLFPEAFGLAALVAILNQGLTLLSDVGLVTVMVQSKRGDDPVFVNTAFTWQAIRGVALWIVALALTWPFALLYGEPELKWLVPVGASSVLILGFRSTSIFTLRRRMQVAPIMLVELGSQIAAVSVMVPWALWQPSVWTLIGGMLASSVTTVIASHFLPKDFPNRFRWDSQAARELFTAGKWLAGSSALTFASQQGDRLMLGRYLGAGALGVYSIAFFLSNALGDALSRLTMGVFFPAYSRLHNEGGARLSGVYYKTRLTVDGLVMPALGGLAVLGPFVVHLLYDDRYVDAGWMLSVLTVRVALGCLALTSQYCLFAMGQTRYGLYLNLARTVALFGGIPIGHALFGVEGLIWAVALCEVPALLVTYYGLAPTGVLRVGKELRAPLGYALGLVLGLGCQWLLEFFGVSGYVLHR